MTCRLRRRPAGADARVVNPHGLGLNGRSLYFCAQLHDHLVFMHCNRRQPWNLFSPAPMPPPDTAR